MSNYIQITREGAVVEQDEEREKHRYLVNKGTNTFDSVNELVEALRSAQQEVGWLPNVRDY